MGENASGPVLVELDARGRLSLGKLARHRRYFAAVDVDGTIVMTPAVAVPAAAGLDSFPAGSADGRRRAAREG
jgi:hypothetical protein